MPQRHLQSGVLPPGTASFEEGAVICLGLDDRMCGACDRCGNGSECLALQVRIAVISGDVSFILVAEAVLALPNGDLSRHPECPSQPGISKLGEFGLSSEYA